MGGLGGRLRARADHGLSGRDASDCVGFAAPDYGDRRDKLGTRVSESEGLEGPASDQSFRQQGPVRRRLPEQRQVGSSSSSSSSPPVLSLLSVLPCFPSGCP